MIQAAGRLHNTASVERLISTTNKSQSSDFQEFGKELSAHLGAESGTRTSASSLPAHLPEGQKPVTWRQNPDASTGSSSSTPASSTTTTTRSTPVNTQKPAEQSFDDAYWAKQPAAVQQLKSIQDPAQRTLMASQLAQQGYSIDVPIMVWGWDPQITTQLRQSMGYTWVPSALQNPVAVAPGIGQGSQPAYDPLHPPAGSITV